MVPTRYGLTTPSITDPEQEVRVRLVFTVRSLDADFHVNMAFPFVKEGRSQGGGRKLSRGSPGVLRRRAESHGAWPWADISAKMSEPRRGRSVGVGTLSVYSMKSRVRTAAWKMYSGETGIEDVT